MKSESKSKVQGRSQGVEIRCGNVGMIYLQSPVATPAPDSKYDDEAPPSVFADLGNISDECVAKPNIDR